MDLPWKIAETEADDSAATVRCTLDSGDYPEAHEGFPFPYRVSATYRLDAGGLRLDFGAENSGDAPLPFGFGAHPFFKMPIGERGSAEECQLSVPASRRWNVRAVRDRLEAGDKSEAGQASRTLTWEDVTIPVPAELDLRSPRPWVSGTFNGMFTGLAPATAVTSAAPDGASEAFIRDPNNGLETVMCASKEFPNIVVWSPPGGLKSASSHGFAHRMSSISPPRACRTTAWSCSNAAKRGARRCGSHSVRPVQTRRWLPRWPMNERRHPRPDESRMPRLGARRPDDHASRATEVLGLTYLVAGAYHQSLPGHATQFLRHAKGMNA